MNDLTQSTTPSTAKSPLATCVCACLGFSVGNAIGWQAGLISGARAIDRSFFMVTAVIVLGFLLRKYREGR